MKLQTQDEQTIRRYLLGKLTDDEREKLEERFFTDKDLLATVDVINDELADEYVFDELSKNEREHFESIMVMQPKKERFASAMKQYSASQKSNVASATNSNEKETFFLFRLFSNRPRLSFAMSVALLITSIGCLFLFYRMRSLQNEISRLRASESVEMLRAKTEELQTELERERQRREQAEKELAQLSDKEKPAQTPTPNNEEQTVIATVFLKPGLMREGETPTQISLNSNTRAVNLQPFLLQDDYPRYTASLSTAEGKSVYSFNSVTPRKTQNGSTLHLQIPAERLTAGDYILKVRGTTNEGQTEDVANYYFRVRR